MSASRLQLETIAQDLLDGGNQRLADPLVVNTPAGQSVRRQARRMIRAADTINGALASDAINGARASDAINGAVASDAINGVVASGTPYQIAS